MKGLKEEVRELFELKPLPFDISTAEIKKKPYISGFHDKADMEVVKATGTTLHMPKPVKLDKVIKGREILQRYSELQGLTDEELLIKAASILPSIENLQSTMLNAIIESEEGRVDSIPIKLYTVTVGFCIDKDGHLCLFFCGRREDGWGLFCIEDALDGEVHAGGLLYLAREKKDI